MSCYSWFYFHISTYLPLLTFFIFLNTLTPTTASSNPSFTFTNFTPSSHFNSLLSLHGDATVANGGLSLQLTVPSTSSSGQVVFKHPFNLFNGSPKKLVSFSSSFAFSLSMNSGVENIENGDGLAFVVFGDDGLLFNGSVMGSFGISGNNNNGGDGGGKFLSVEFDTLRDEKYGDVNGNHVGIDLSSFVSLKAVNFSGFGLGLSSGDILQVWIDYESMSRRLEVRLSKFGESRPVDPLLFQRIDLDKIWNGSERFFVGLSSANGNWNSSQICNVYSWRFETRRAPDWMHSEPLDPIVFKQREENKVKIHKKSDCVMRILSALILGIGLGAMGSFIGMFVWMLCAKRQPISPEEYATKPVVHDKASANEKQ